MKKLSHQPLILTLLAGLLAAGAVARAAATSASGPAASTAVAPASYNTPEEAMRSYVEARFAKDAARTREAIDVPAARKADVEALVEAIVASDGLQKAAVVRFGADGSKAFDPDSAAKKTAALKALENLKAGVEGNKAMFPGVPDEEGKPGSPTVLIKTAAGWKIDGAVLLDAAGDGAEVLAQRVALFKEAATVANKVIGDINAGKYPAASDAYRDYVKLMGQAVRGAASQAATTPAATSAPATATAPETRKP